MKSSKNSFLKMVVIGDDMVGKSCLMTRFVMNSFSKYTYPTIGVEFMNRELEINNEKFILQIWDTAGQERFKSLRTLFYRGSDICILTFAVDDKSSFQNIPFWQSEFINYADIKDEALFPFVVVGNKIDKEEREVSEVEALAWCKVNGNVPYVETSAKDATNVTKAFETAVEAWVKHEKTITSSDLQFKAVSLHTEKERGSLTCCT